MAKEIGLSGQYRMVYGNISSGAHFDSWGIRAFFLGADEEAIHLDQKPVTGATALKTSLYCIHKISEIGNKEFNFVPHELVAEWESKIEDAIKEF